MPALFPLPGDIPELGFHHVGRMAFNADILLDLYARPGSGEKLFFKFRLPIRLGGRGKHQKNK
jgi:hypothetical protein